MMGNWSDMAFALMLANAVTEEDIGELPFKKGDVTPDDLRALSEGLYRAGCLIAFADGHGERSDMESFTSIHVNGGNTFAKAYLPTTPEMEDTMAAEGEGWSKPVPYQMQVPSTPETSAGEFAAGAFANRKTDGNWIIVELTLTRHDYEAEASERTVIAILGQMVADSQIRGIQPHFWYGDAITRQRIWYQSPWLALASAPRKSRPGVCRNCGRLHISHNTRGNLAASCSPECTTQFNNEKKRLLRLNGPDAYPMNGSLDKAAWRAHERRPLLFPGKPEGVDAL
jgi:hypothetical protein